MKEKQKDLASKSDKTSREVYEPTKIEPYWQSIWQKQGIYQPDLDSANRPFYNLMMFPYPSAEGMHVGNMYAFTGSDIYGRYKRMQGYDVLEPIGLDGFGIHSENYAFKTGRHPMDQAQTSQENFYRQLKATGNGFDWSRTVETYDQKYYKWTQWIFVQLFKAGLAYKKKAPVNFCPSCKTVLADEQVIDLRCERCGTLVEKRALSQWFFRITKYAERLLKNLDTLNWSEKVKIAQKNWIGKSSGTEITFKMDGYDLDITVFTVFPETIFGVTYMVLAPEHDLVSKIIIKEQEKAVENYIKESQRKSNKERTAEDKKKTGVFTGAYCINPVTGKKVPVWIADYVIAEYGTGAVMGVPGSDHRDFEFARTYKLPIIRVIAKRKDDKSLVTSEEEVLEKGVLVNSGKFSGLSTPHPAKEKIIVWLEEKGFGKRKAQYHLRDWLISRQRYWGAPIPMIYCEYCAKEGKSWFTQGAKSEKLRAESIRGIENWKLKIGNSAASDAAGWYPVPTENLPVELPYINDYKPMGTGKAPLENHPGFFKVKCPGCARGAHRETDVSDTFLDSSWYFLRYLVTERDDIPFPSEAFEKSQMSNEKQIGNFAQRSKWLPVTMYIGGAEHSVLHLLYSRFLTMVFKDLGFLSFEEPFARFYAHGLLIKEGSKMSKSKGNVVIPDEYIKKFGADTLRTYLMFLGPFSAGGDFYDTGIEGIHRFLKRVWTLVTKYPISNIQYTETNKIEDKELERLMHKTIKAVTEDLENLRYNTAIAHIMEYYNGLSDFYTKHKELNTKYSKILLQLLAPFAPHMTEELWQKSEKLRAKSEEQGEFSSIHFYQWPTYDEKYLEEKELTIIVQVNGKLRDSIKYTVLSIKDKEMVEKKARESEKVKRYLDAKTVKKVIYIPGKVINFVAID